MARAVAMASLVVLALAATHSAPSATEVLTYDDLLAPGAAAAAEPEAPGDAVGDDDIAAALDPDSAAADADVPDGAGAGLAADADPEPPVAARFTAADTLAAVATASSRAACIVRVEVGGVGWNPYAVGRQGEQGAAQLHPRGLLPDFYRQGFTDPFNPYQAVRYVDAALARGLASHWAGVRLGRC